MIETCGRELESLLHPTSIATFFEKHWEKTPLHVKGDAGRYAPLGFDRAAFWRAVRELDQDARCVRAMFYDAAGKHQEIPVVAPDVAPSLYEAGMTICFTQLEDNVDAIGALARSLRGALNLPGQITVGCYLSPRDHGFGLHYDDHSVIVLQLEGAKRWTVSREPALEFPPRNDGYQSDEALIERNAKNPELRTRLPKESELVELTLEPGDLLYMPPGTWHRARAAEWSLALTLGNFVKTPLALVQEQLARGLAQRKEWRRSVPVSPASSGLVGLPPEVETFFADRLNDLRAYVNGLTTQDLARLWHAQVAAPPVVCLDDLAREARPIAPEDQIFVNHARRASATRAKDAHGDEKLYLYLDGEEIDLPATAGEFVETLLAKDSFVAADARTWVAADEEPYDWDDVKAILAVLTSRGWLHRAGDPASCPTR